MVLNEGVSGGGIQVGCHGGNASVHKDTEGHMEVLFDGNFNVNHLSQVVRDDGPLKLPVLWKEKL